MYDSASTRLAHLIASGQNLRDKGTILVAEQIAANCMVRELLLSSNDITDVGGIVIAKALESNGNLRILVLGENRLTDVTAEAFAKVLKTNKALKELNLSSNHITDKGAIALSKSCPNLEVLSLKGNSSITVTGGIVLLDAIFSASALRDVDLRETSLPRDTLSQVVKASATRRPGPGSITNLASLSLSAGVVLPLASSAQPQLGQVVQLSTDPGAQSTIDNVRQQISTLQRVRTRRKEQFVNHCNESEARAMEEITALHADNAKLQKEIAEVTQKLNGITGDLHMALQRVTAMLPSSPRPESPPVGNSPPSTSPRTVSPRPVSPRVASPRTLSPERPARPARPGTWHAKVGDREKEKEKEKEKERERERRREAIKKRDNNDKEKEKEKDRKDEKKDKDGKDKEKEKRSPQKPHFKWLKSAKEREVIIASKWDDLPRSLRQSMKNVAPEALNARWPLVCNIFAFTDGVLIMPSAEEADKAREAREEIHEREVDNAALRSLISPGDPRDFIKKLQPLGDGASGKVYSAVLLNDNKKTVAVKQMHVKNQRERDAILKELSVLRQVHKLQPHPNILIEHGVYEKDSEMWICMELVEGSTLASLTLNQGLDAEPLAYIIKDVLSALKYLHSLSLVHGDVKASNIMVSTQGAVKLIDFDLCFKESHHRRGMGGTAAFLAPEIIFGQLYGTPVDVYALGMTVFEAANGGISERAPRAMWRNATEEVLPLPKRTKPAVSLFIARCLTRQVDKRPTCAELFSDPFITEGGTKEDLRALIPGLFVNAHLQNWG